MSEDATPRPLSQLALLLPAVRGTKSPSRCTLYRWATVGLRDAIGHRRTLPTQFIGGTRCASLADVRQFFDSKKEIVRSKTNSASYTKAELAEMRRRGQAANDWLVKRGY